MSRKQSSEGTAYPGAMELIVLWDIDHTLIENAGVSKEIYAAAFSSLAGREPSEPARTEGRTDRLIMRDMFLRDGLPVPEWSVIEATLAQAGHDRLDDLRLRGTALPGVHEVLKAAAARSGWVSSVLTGNIAANAQVKLSAFGLDSLLDLPAGAYGADAELRPQLVAVARERIQQLRGVAADVPVVLVGDTPATWKPPSPLVPQSLRSPLVSTVPRSWPLPAPTTSSPTCRTPGGFSESWSPSRTRKTSQDVLGPSPNAVTRSPGKPPPSGFPPGSQPNEPM